MHVCFKGHTLWGNFGCISLGENSFDLLSSYCW